METKKFYCIYCGHEKPIKENSKEHVIPQYLFGKFIINEVCRYCNHKMGRMVENSLPIYIRFVKFLKIGHIDTEAIASLFDGKLVEGKVKIIEQKNPPGNYKIKEFKDKNNCDIDINKIDHVRVLGYDPKSVPQVRGAIAKIAFASIHYLLNYNIQPKRQYLDFLDCPELGGLRLFFNPNARKWPGKSFCAYSIHHIAFHNFYDKITSKPNPEIRRNILEIKQKGNNIEVEITLLSQFMWRVTIFNYNLPIEHCIEESLLHELNPFRFPPKSHQPGDGEQYLYIKTN